MTNRDEISSYLKAAAPSGSPGSCSRGSSLYEAAGSLSSSILIIFILITRTPPEGPRPPETESRRQVAFYDPSTPAARKQPGFTACLPVFIPPCLDNFT